VDGEIFVVWLLMAHASTRMPDRRGHSRAARHLLRQGDVEPEGDKHRENGGPARLRGVGLVQTAD
jgi:hypothetical protein